MSMLMCFKGIVDAAEYPSVASLCKSKFKAKGPW